MPTFAFCKSGGTTGVRVTLFYLSSPVTSSIPGNPLNLNQIQFPPNVPLAHAHPSYWK